jgi:hypothetical protein
VRENVNRYLREWQRRGILQLKNRWIIILKPEVLHLIEEPYGTRLPACAPHSPSNQLDRVSA